MQNSLTINIDGAGNILTSEHVALEGTRQERLCVRKFFGNPYFPCKSLISSSPPLSTSPT